MDYKSHLVAGIAAGVGTTYLVNSLGIEADYTGLMICSVVGSLLPDIDHPKSFLGRRLPLISKPLNHHFGHRGFTHTILFALLVALFLTFVIDSLAGIGMFVGCLSHLLLDQLPYNLFKK